MEYSTAFDGTPISLIGYPVADTLIDTLMDANTWQYIWKKDGRILEREFERLSADGKIFRETDQKKDKKGRKYKNYLVFERP